MDYVSEESAGAGRSAALYVQNAESSSGRIINICAGNGVRYTVPSFANPENLKDDLIIRFRSGNVYKDSYIDVLFDGVQKLHRKKQIITPGEMEQVILKKTDLDQGISEITVRISEG